MKTNQLINTLYFLKLIFIYHNITRLIMAGRIIYTYIKPSGFDYYNLVFTYEGTDALDEAKQKGYPIQILDDDTYIIFSCITGMIENGHGCASWYNLTGTDPEKDYEMACDGMDEEHNPCIEVEIELHHVDCAKVRDSLERTECDYVYAQYGHTKVLKRFERFFQQ